MTHFIDLLPSTPWSYGL